MALLVSNASKHFPEKHTTFQGGSQTAAEHRTCVQWLGMTGDDTAGALPLKPFLLLLGSPFPPPLKRVAYMILSRFLEPHRASAQEARHMF